MLGSGKLVNFNISIGAFGEVRMCVHRDSGAQRAVKVLRKSHMDDDEKKMLFNEINILKDLVRADLINLLKISWHTLTKIYRTIQTF